jgi:hypothetical protein
VSAFVTAAQIKFLLLHDGRSEDSVKGFFKEVYDGYLRVCSPPSCTALYVVLCIKLVLGIWAHLSRRRGRAAVTLPRYDGRNRGQCPIDVVCCAGWLPRLS